MNVQTAYQKAIVFAAGKHAYAKQTIPGTDLPYVVHLSNVAMEILVAGAASPGFDLPFAVQVALLHDTLEDTGTTMDDLAAEFGVTVADAVAALTKDGELQNDLRMADSLARIRKQQKEVWAVKLADRITNLQPPPLHWDREKILAYRAEAEAILAGLKGGNAYLEARLHSKIIGYAAYCAPR